ncbi:N-sulphoglucosamine sulphohydrolase-like [Corticium candelabrum]|uniref:N-sulphoglucosamine sulphohydrolase-like n=1 Tax=Corticium candelabrum TaxID=121492 RepID=UPI002E25B4DC|nr:N-sulphoglucosamine sulphohydrolase-like [Corticium candelabrum]
MAGSILLFGCLLAVSQGCYNKKNVLFLIADDGGFEASVYNNSAIRSPNIDALGAMSTIFDRAFTSVSSCSPSRSAILTGMPTHQNGMYGLEHATHHFRSFDDVRSLPMLLAYAGYRTGIIGKKHVAPEAVYPFNFSKTEFDDPGMSRQFGRNITLIKELADSFLDECQHDSSPIFLYIGFRDPHRCGGAAGSFCEVWGSGGDNGVIPDWKPQYYQPEEIKVPYHVPDTPAARDDLTKQYTSISRMDQGIGLLIESFKKHGLLNSTLIVYFSDNGIPFPAAKTNLYECGMGEPLFVYSPTAKAQGIHSRVLASSLDLVPTVLDWSDVKYPSYKLNGMEVNLTGHSLLPVVEGHADPKDYDTVFASHQMHEVTMYYPMRVIHQGSYKLILNIANNLSYPIAEDLYGSETWQDVLKREAQGQAQHWYRTINQYYFRPKWELFNLESDPMELHNLADDTAHTETLQSLQQQLKTWQHKTNDPWMVKYTHE